MKYRQAYDSDSDDFHIKTLAVILLCFSEETEGFRPAALHYPQYNLAKWHHLSPIFEITCSFLWSYERLYITFLKCSMCKNGADTL